MTSPTLERAARACAFYRDGGANFEAWDSLHDAAQAKYRLQARAVLTAVLPELKRYEPYEHHGSYEENQSDNGPWVKFDDLTAILAEGE